MTSSAQPPPPPRRAPRPLEHATRRPDQPAGAAGPAPVPLDPPELDRCQTYTEYADTLARLGLEPEPDG